MVRELCLITQCVTQRSLIWGYLCVSGYPYMSQRVEKGGYLIEPLLKRWLQKGATPLMNLVAILVAR